MRQNRLSPRDPDPCLVFVVNLGAVPFSFPFFSDIFFPTFRLLIFALPSLSTPINHQHLNLNVVRTRLSHLVPLAPY